MMQRSRRLALVLVLSSMGAVPYARGQAPPPGTPEAMPDMRQQEPALALTGGGDLLLAWSQSYGGQSEVRVRRLEYGVHTGATAGDHGQAFARSSRPGWRPGDQRSPAFGPGFLVWSEQRPGEADHDLFAQRHGAAGLAMGRPVRLVARAGDQRNPAVAADASGALLLVWEELGATSLLDIWGVRLSGALVARGAPILLAGGQDNASEPTLAADPVDGDGYLLIWSDDRHWLPDLYGLRLTRSGLPERRGPGAELAIVTGTDAAVSPSLVTSTEGAFGDGALLAWHHFTEGDIAGSSQVRAMRLRRGGLPDGEPFLVASGLFFDQQPALAPDPSGGWTAVWVHAVEEDIPGIWRWLVQRGVREEPPPRVTSTPEPSPTPLTGAALLTGRDLWGTTIDRQGRVGQPARPVVVR